MSINDNIPQNWPSNAARPVKDSWGPAHPDDVKALTEVVVVASPLRGSSCEFLPRRMARAESGEIFSSKPLHSALLEASGIGPEAGGEWTLDRLAEQWRLHFTGIGPVEEHLFDHLLEQSMSHLCRGFFKSCTAKAAPGAAPPEDLVRQMLLQVIDTLPPGSQSARAARATLDSLMTLQALYIRFPAARDTLLCAADSTLYGKFVRRDVDGGPDDWGRFQHAPTTRPEHDALRRELPALMEALIAAGFCPEPDINRRMMEALRRWLDSTAPHLSGIMRQLPVWLTGDGAGER